MLVPDRFRQHHIRQGAQRGNLRLKLLTLDLRVDSCRCLLYIRLELLLARADEVIE